MAIGFSAQQSSGMSMPYSQVSRNAISATTRCICSASNRRAHMQIRPRVSPLPEVCCLAIATTLAKEDGPLAAAAGACVAA